MAAVDRLLNLAAALLNSEQPLPIDQIRAQVRGYEQGNDESFRRMFERDKSDLIDMGLDVTYVEAGEGRSGYTARRADVLAAIDLTPVELAALHLAVTSVVLDGVDEDQVTSGIHKLGGTVGGSGRPVAEIPMPGVLAELFDAVLHHRVATFEYAPSDGATSERRELEPHRLQFELGNWYVSGHDRGRDAGRSFRVDRIRSAVALGPAEEFTVPEQRKGVNVRPWELGDGPAVTAQVRLDRTVAPSFLGTAGPVQVVEQSPDGTVVVELAVTRPDGLFNVLLNLLDGAELLAPAELRAEFVSTLTAMAEEG